MALLSPPFVAMCGIRTRGPLGICFPSRSVVFVREQKNPEFTRKRSYWTRPPLLATQPTSRHCGGRGIRTLGTLLACTRFPIVLLRPLGHPTIFQKTRTQRGTRTPNHHPLKMAGLAISAPVHKKEGARYTPSPFICSMK
jgi:hypothetical protein